MSDFNWKNCGNCKHKLELYKDPESRCFKCLESEEPNEYWEPRDD